jgi:hypothetical protein
VDNWESRPIVVVSWFRDFCDLGKPGKPGIFLLMIQKWNEIMSITFSSGLVWFGFFLSIGVWLFVFDYFCLFLVDQCEMILLK